MAKKQNARPARGRPRTKDPVIEELKRATDKMRKRAEKQRTDK